MAWTHALKQVRRAPEAAPAEGGAANNADWGHGARTSTLQTASPSLQVRRQHSDHCCFNRKQCPTCPRRIG